MNFKKIMLITLLLLAVLTIGSVSAAEDAGALAVDDAGDDTVVEAPVDEDATQTAVADEEVMEASEGSDALGSSANATFTELKSIIDSAGAGTTVNLENDYLYDGSGSISISKQLTINGKCHTINGNSQSCAFVITGKVTLENITFTNCAGKLGGAISIDSSASNCNVRSCNFINCYGVETYGTYQSPNQGGAILNDGANTNIDSCTFRNCSTYDGGAIYSTISSCKITSCDFRDCHASNQGGAIHIGTDSIIESCNFTNCACDNKGGAIFNTAPTCTVNSCRFENCTAFTGNAIHNQAGKTKANKCRFVDLLEGQVGSGVEFTDCLFKDSADAKITDVDLVSGYNYGENAVVKVMTNVAGNLTVKVDDVSVNTTTIAANTFKSFDLGILDAGWHDVECILDAGSMYDIAKNGVGFGVNPKSTYVSVYTSESYVYGENVVVRVYANANGTIALKVGEKVNNIKFNATKSVPVDLGVLGIGTHNFTANFTPDDVKNYENSSKEGSFVVSSLQAKITYLNAKDCVYGENAVVNVKTNVGGNLTIKVGETTKSVTMVANELTPIDFGVMDSGSYNILANFTDGISSDSNNSMSLSISKAQSEITTLQTGRYVYGDEVKIYVETNVNGNLTVKVGDAAYMELPIAANQLKNISFGVLDSGSYDVVVKLFAGKNYIPSNETRSINVLYKLEDKDVNITVPEVKKGSESIVVKLPSDATGNLKIIIGDKDYPFGKIVDGVASCKVPTLANGDYKYTIMYSGNDKYTNYTSSGILKVNMPVKTTLLASAVSTVYDGGKYLVATLKDNNGNVINGQKLTVVIGSKTFTPTTDKNGQVKVSTDGLAPKNYYTASITFKGNAKYAPSTKSVKVIVTKATPKLTAKAKSFKKSVKTKQYTVTLKTNRNQVLKNAKVTITVNKKTYSAKTNSKGQATFKITKLTKKGKYTAVVKYAGNSNYKAVTVKPKITIK